MVKSKSCILIKLIPQSISALTSTDFIQNDVMSTRRLHYFWDECRGAYREIVLIDHIFQPGKEISNSKQQVQLLGLWPLAYTGKAHVTTITCVHVYVCMYMCTRMQASMQTCTYIYMNV